MDNFDYGSVVVMTLIIIGSVTGAYLSVKGASVDVLYGMFLSLVGLAFFLIWRRNRDAPS
jgi:hypothetical protein